MKKIIVYIQSRYKAMLSRRKYIQTRKKVVHIQKWFRKRLAKKKFNAKLTVYKSRIEEAELSK
jgi:hypothetical protein